MKRNKIIKLINKAMIVSYVANFTPALALENVVNIDNQESNVLSNDETEIPTESLEDSSSVVDDEKSIIDEEIKEDICEENVVDSSLSDEEFTTGDVGTDMESNVSSELIIDETIVNNEDKDGNEGITETEVLSERAVIEDNWVNREVAKQVYGDGSKYTQLTDDDYLKVTELVYNNWSETSIPSDLFKLKNLEVLDLRLSSCTNTFPKEICELTNLTTLKINSKFTGELPTELCNLINLETLYLSVSCTGDIQILIDNLKNLTHLELDFCRNLTGTIPDSIGDLSNLEYLSIWYADGLTGNIPETIGKLSNLKELYISARGITGSIPNSIGDLKKLEHLQIEETSITGSIPETIGDLESLVYLQIFYTKISGGIPETIANLDNLEEVYITSNYRLDGNIPDSIGNLKSIQYLEINDNKITGSIPESIGNLKTIRSINFSFNKLTGSIPESIGNLTTISGLNLSNNQITGSIPETIGNMSSLTQLILNENNLTGNIPESLSNITRPSSINLSGNKLTGFIPTSMDDLYTKNPWFDLNVSNNQLIGELSAVMSKQSSVYFKNNFFVNATDQAQLKFDDNSEIEIDINNPVNIDDIKNKVLVLRNIYGEDSYDTLSSDYDIKITSDDESILTNDLNTVNLGETEITVSLDIGSDANTYTTTNNKLKVKVTDLSGPELNLEQSNSDWTNSSVTIKGSASDNYILDRIILPDGTEVKTSEFEYTITTNGEYTFEAYDSFNNKTTKTITVNNIDIEKPIILVDKVLKDNNTVDLKIDVEDSLSGVKEIKVNGLALKNLKNPVVNVMRNGIYNIVVLDNAGNETSYSIDVTEIKAISVDNEKPDNSKPSQSGNDSDNKNDDNNSSSLIDKMPSTGGIAGIGNSIAIMLLTVGAYLVGKNKFK